MSRLNSIIFGARAGIEHPLYPNPVIPLENDRIHVSDDVDRRGGESVAVQFVEQQQDADRGYRQKSTQMTEFRLL